MQGEGIIDSRLAVTPMTRIALPLASVLVLAALAGCFHSQEAAKALVVGTDAAFPPFENYVSSTGKYEGFDVDLMTEIAKRMGRTVEWKNLGFDPLIPALQNGQIDAAISAMSITDARKQQVDFSDPYYLANQSALVQSSSTISKQDDVNKASIKIGVQRGTVGQSVAENMSNNPQVSAFDTYPAAVAALKAGQVDVVLMDRPAQVEQAKSDASVKVVFDIFTDDNYGIAVKMGNVALLNDINKHLAAIKRDGTMATLMTKWSV